MITLKKYLKKSLFLNIFLLFLTFYFNILSDSIVYAQETDEFLVKSVFILKIPVFIEWPENTSGVNTSKDFVIDIIGKDPFKGKLQSIIQSRNIKIKNRNITINYISKIENSDGADMLFISNSEKNNLPIIIKYLQNKSVLTISDSKAFLDKGIMINMYIEGSTLKFDVNLKQANESKMYISSKLLVNANKVIK
jgi:hypothetical protein